MIWGTIRLEAQQSFPGDIKLLKLAAGHELLWSWNILISVSCHSTREK